MSAQTRNYTTLDYQVSRFTYENRALDGTVNGLRTPIIEASTDLTINRAKRLKRLNLLDGDELSTFDGEFVKLTALGIKTAREAIRLGIPST